ncbi:MAG: metal-dependent transcriptional regulator [Phycisphaerales bacterium]|nr:MAG: metal-dependent transcriptional regulator [Phycisphaerales bacterium]
MNHKREKDEHIERLYYMKEDGTDSMVALKSTMNENYAAAIIDELLSEDMIQLSEDSNIIALTEKGTGYARQLIRAHRLAERLLYDVLGGDFESGACEFEHTITSELVDSICILLGHPRACPHGSPIPQGQCCRESCRTAQSSVVPLVELEVGQSARVAYINCKSDQQLHKIDSLCIRPGVIATLHQRYPSYVIECEGSNIAMDKQIASNICVWKEPEHFPLAGKEPPGQPNIEKTGRSIFRHDKQGTHTVATSTTVPPSHQSHEKKGILCYFRSKRPRQEQNSLGM